MQEHIIRRWHVDIRYGIPIADVWCLEISISRVFTIMFIITETWGGLGWYKIKIDDELQAMPTDCMA